MEQHEAAEKFKRLCEQVQGVKSFQYPSCEEYLGPVKPAGIVELEIFENNVSQSKTPYLVLAERVDPKYCSDTESPANGQYIVFAQLTKDWTLEDLMELEQSELWNLKNFYFENGGEICNLRSERRMRWQVLYRDPSAENGTAVVQSAIETQLSMETVPVENKRFCRHCGTAMQSGPYCPKCGKAEQTDYSNEDLEGVNAILREIESGNRDRQVDAIMRIPKVCRGRLEAVRTRVLVKLSNCDFGIQTIGCMALAEIGDNSDPVANQLLRALQAEELQSPDHIFMTLSGLSYVKGRQDVLDAIENLLESTEIEKVRDGAFCALGAIGNPDSIHVLERAAKRSTAARVALKEFGRLTFSEIYGAHAALGRSGATRPAEFALQGSEPIHNQRRFYGNWLLAFFAVGWSVLSFVIYFDKNNDGMLGFGAYNGALALLYTLSCMAPSSLISARSTAGKPAFDRTPIGWELVPLVAFLPIWMPLVVLKNFVRCFLLGK